MSNNNNSNRQPASPVDSQQIHIEILSPAQRKLYEDCIQTRDVQSDEELGMTLRSRLKKSISCIENIKVGSEISFGRRGYKHHAVVVSVNNTTKIYKIIHLSGDSFGAVSGTSSSGDGKAKPYQQGMTMADTPAGSSFYYDYGKQKAHNGEQKVAFEPEIVKARAEALVEVMLEIKDVNYHVRNFNCQHFASYCVTGVPFCRPYQQNLCCFERGIAVNKEVKDKLDKGLKAYFTDKLKEPSAPATKQNKQNSLEAKFVEPF